MNAENFAQYLKNPSQLYQISYQELKSLVLQYPYSQNLRYLLLLKSKIDQHKDLAANLEKAAAYSIDRTFLFKLIKEKELEALESESFTINEDYLELKDLSILSDEPVEEIKEEVKALEADIPVVDNPPQEIKLEELLDNTLSEESEDLEDLPIELDIEPKEKIPSSDEVEETISEPINSSEEEIVAPEGFFISKDLSADLAAFSKVSQQLSINTVSKEDAGKDTSTEEEIY